MLGLHVGAELAQGLREQGHQLVAGSCPNVAAISSAVSRVSSPARHGPNAVSGRPPPCGTPTGRAASQGGEPARAEVHRVELEAEPARSSSAAPGGRSGAGGDSAGSVQA